MTSEENHIGAIKALVKSAETHRDNRSADRSDAVDYYNGDMKKTLPSEEGRSSVVSRDVRAACKDVLPSLMRSLTGTNNLFEFKPVERGDEEHTQQSSDYINHFVFKECHGARTVHDALADSLLLRTGVIEARWEEKTTVEVQRYTGLVEDELLEFDDDDIEILEQDSRIELISPPIEGTEETQEIEVEVFNLKIRRRVTQGDLVSRAVPLEEFLHSSEATSLKDASLVGTVRTLTRSDLISMGYDEGTVKDLPTTKDAQDEQAQSRNERSDQESGEDTPAYLEEIEYYDLYVKMDLDGDGINELVRCCFGGKISEETKLFMEHWDRIPFVQIQTEWQAHQLEGASIADDVMEIQKIKTQLLRSVNDNLYAQNDQQVIVDETGIVNMDAIYNPEFGKPIIVQGGRNVNDVLGYREVPFMADKAFSMLEYYDNVIQDRTGISDASSGMAPDALQNMTAKASAMIEQAGIGQVESMLRVAANGLSEFGKLLLYLTHQHQDKPRTVRLRDKWVEYDPRAWNVNMDVEVNTGLGAGSRERDMMMMRLIIDLQEKLLAAFGLDNPFVKPDNVYRAITALVEAAGIKSPEMFFTQPDANEIKRKLDDAKNAPNPELEKEKIKAQMQGEIEKVKAQAAGQLEQMKLQIATEMKTMEIQASRDKEAAQRDADLAVKDKELQNAQQIEAFKTEAELVKQDDQQAHEVALKEMDFDTQMAVKQVEAELNPQEPAAA